MDSELEYIFGAGNPIKQEWIDAIRRGESLSGFTGVTAAENRALTHATFITSNEDGSINTSFAQRLQTMTDELKSATKSYEAQEQKYTIEVNSNTDFQEYLDKHGTKDSSGNVDLDATLSNVQTELLRVAQVANNLEKREEAFKKIEAKINFDEMRGQLDPAKQAIIDKHRAANPKK